jgi:RNA polymerase sigma-70 factor, ECF subfamily
MPLEIGPLHSWDEITPSLRRFIRRHVRNTQTAEDVFQEVILRLESHRAQMPPPERRLPWALRIARNFIIDQGRAAKFRQHRSLDTDVPAIGATIDRAAQKELAHCLQAMVDRLPAAYRQPLRLSDLEGMDQQAIARRLNLSPSGVRSRVQRARAQLRRMLLGCCEIEHGPRGDIVDYRPKPHCRQACAKFATAASHAESCVNSPAHPSTEMNAEESAEISF